MIVAIAVIDVYYARHDYRARLQKTIICSLRMMPRYTISIATLLATQRVLRGTRRAMRCVVQRACALCRASARASAALRVLRVRRHAVLCARHRYRHNDIITMMLTMLIFC